MTKNAAVRYQSRRTPLAGMAVRFGLTSLMGLAVLPVICLVLISSVAAQTRDAPPPLDPQRLGGPASGLPEAALAAQELSEQISQRMSTSEWLGPLAPVALSPFFGITCLSGLAIFGDQLGADNALLQAAGPLKSPLLFWTFLALTIATSLPRFSKVSKPVAQAVDQLEAAAGILTLMAVRYLTGGELAGGEEVAAVVQAGVFTIPVEALLYLAMVLNIVAINTVKFFFEILVWITPFPLVDAIFEAANKSVCAAMMAIYAFSPAIAAVINLILFAACAIAFRWVKRREVYYRTLMVDAVTGWLNKAAVSVGPTVPCTVFPRESVGDIPAKAKCTLRKVNEGWDLRFRRLWRPAIIERISSSHTLTLEKGWLTSEFHFEGTHPIELTASRRYHASLDQMAAELGATASLTDRKQPADLRLELA